MRDLDREFDLLPAALLPWEDGGGSASVGPAPIFGTVRGPVAIGSAWSAVPDRDLDRDLDSRLKIDMVVVVESDFLAELALLLVVSEFLRNRMFTFTFILLLRNDRRVWFLCVILHCCLRCLDLCLFSTKRGCFFLSFWRCVKEIRACH
jgi:hypothetical protein